MSRRCERSELSEKRPGRVQNPDNLKFKFAQFVIRHFFRRHPRKKSEAAVGGVSFLRALFAYFSQAPTRSPNATPTSFAFFAVWPHAYGDWEGSRHG